MTIQLSEIQVSKLSAETIRPTESLDDGGIIRRFAPTAGISGHKPSVHVARVLGALALIAVTVSPSVHRGDADGARNSAAPSADSSRLAPTVLAQGRCFNGKCY